jgi:hypothetical protein
MSIDLKADRKARQAAEATKAMAEYRAQQAAVDANTARLRALRLAREAQLAADPPVAAVAATKGATAPKKKVRRATSRGAV